MICAGEVPIKEVFTAMDDAEGKFMDIRGNKVNAHSARYKLFKKKGTTCVTCGLKAVYFKLERFPNDKGFHLNLYGLDHIGDEVLLTKDHKVASANGGPNNHNNFQTMCMPCNAFKRDK